MIATTVFDGGASVGKNSSGPQVGSTLPAYAYYAALEKQLPLQAGIEWDFAYSPIQLTASKPGDQVAFATVDAFVPLIDCQVLETTVGPLTPLDNPLVAAAEPGSLSFPIMFSGGPCEFWPSLSYGGNITENTGEKTRYISGVQNPVACASSAALGASTQPLDAWTMYLVSDWHCSSTFCNITQAVSAACRPSHVLAKANATVDIRPAKRMSANIIDLEQAKSEKRTIPGLSNAAMLNAFSSMTDWSDSFLAVIPNNSQLVSSAVFQLMTLEMGSDPEILFNGPLMKLALEKVYKGVMSQYGQQVLAKTAAVPLRGTSTREEDQLFIQEGALWAMTIAFTCLMGVCVLLLVKRPKPLLP